MIIINVPPNVMYEIFSPFEFILKLLTTKKVNRPGWKWFFYKNNSIFVWILSVEWIKFFIEFVQKDKKTESHDDHFIFNANLDVYQWILTKLMMNTYFYAAQSTGKNFSTFFGHKMTVYFMKLTACHEQIAHAPLKLIRAACFHH